MTSRTPFLTLALVLGALAAGCSGGSGDGTPPPVPDAGPMTDSAMPTDTGPGEPLTCVEFCEDARASGCDFPITCEVACARFEATCPADVEALRVCGGDNPTTVCISGITVFGCEAESAAFAGCANATLFICDERVGTPVAPDENTTRYEPTIAACAGETMSATDCEADKQGDLQVDYLGDDLIGVYLAFAIDDTFTAGDVRSVTLELAAAERGGADSSQSGALWLVEPFTRDGLDTGLPAVVGDAPIVADPGPLDHCAYQHYEIPVEHITPGETLYLLLQGGTGIGGMNAVIYAGPDSDAPPALYVAH